MPLLWRRLPVIVRAVLTGIVVATVLWLFYRFESTTTLVTAGAYRYIRHPLYESGLMLAWGAALKAPSAPTRLFIPFIVWVRVAGGRRQWEHCRVAIS